MIVFALDCVMKAVRRRSRSASGDPAMVSTIRSPTILTSLRSLRLTLAASGVKDLWARVCFHITGQGDVANSQNHLAGARAAAPETGMGEFKA